MVETWLFKCGYIATACPDSSIAFLYCIILYHVAIFSYQFMSVVSLQLQCYILPSLYVVLISIKYRFFAIYIQ